MAVYKEQEFKAFIKTLKWGSAAHWLDIAEALNVDKNTITAWKELPEAKEAIQEGIYRALAAMEQAGAKDWRMWEAKLKMLGVNPPQRVEADISDSRKEILKKYLGDEDAGEAKEAESRSPSDSA